MDDLTGQRFGRLVVTGPAPSMGRASGRLYARCDCGRKDVLVFGHMLRSKQVTQCRACSHQGGRERANARRRVPSNSETKRKHGTNGPLALVPGMRVGSFTLVRADWYRAWAVCDCERSWQGHRTAFTAKLRCDYEGHGLLLKREVALPALETAPTPEVAHPTPEVAHLTAARESRRAAASQRAKRDWATPETRAERMRALGAKRVERLQTLVGKRFEHIEIIAFDADERTVVIRCDCGTVKEKPANQWRQSRSCGCLTRNRTSCYGVQHVEPVASVVETWRTEGLARAMAKAATVQPVEVRPVQQPVAPEPDLRVSDRAVLLAVQRTLAARGYPPTMGELLDAVATPERPFVPVVDCLRRLEVAGYIERSHVSARAMKVLRPIAEGN
jgi:hypothetical protein